MTARELAGLIDHAILMPQATADDLRAGCELGRQLGVATVCVRPCDVAQAAKLLAGSGVGVSTVIGFPHGSSTPAIKAAEAQAAVADGANELDMVANIGRLRSGQVDYVRDDIAAVVRAAAGRPVKVILECCFLDRDQQAAGCRAAIHAGARFVKTSTGFGPGGATIEDVRFLREQVGQAMGVKASGGIASAAVAISLLAAGANRLGTSHTEKICSELSS